MLDTWDTVWLLKYEQRDRIPNWETQLRLSSERQALELDAHRSSVHRCFHRDPDRHRDHHRLPAPCVVAQVTHGAPGCRLPVPLLLLDHNRPEATRMGGRSP